MYRPDFPKLGLSLLLNSLLCGLPVVAIAQTTSKPATPAKPNQTNNRNKQSGVQVKVPIKTLPGRREAGSTRRGSCISGDPALLVLLLPSTNLGLTTAAYPRFFWYTPENTAQRTQFSLYKVDDKSQQRILVYNRAFKPSSEAGVTSLALPNDGKIPPLGINQTYEWSVSLICDIQDTSPQSIIIVNGWVQRLALSNNLANQLQRLSQRERISVYAKQGLWFDLLSTVAELRACNPSDTKLSDIWVNLLQQVELEALAQQPLRLQCTP